jgi:hypothetical protein
MELSPEAERNTKLAVGVVATAASRYFFIKRQLWPWRVRRMGIIRLLVASSVQAVHLTSPACLCR